MDTEWCEHGQTFLVLKPFWFRQTQRHRLPLEAQKDSGLAMPSITNVGGSLTSAVALTLLAWAVRFVRARNSRKQDEKELHKQLGRFHASISAAALHILVLHCPTKFASMSFLSRLITPRACSSVLMCVFQVQKDPIPHVVIDVRDKQVAEQHPLPTQLGKVVAIPGTSVSLVYCQQVLLQTKTGVALMRSQSNTACTSSNAVMVNTCTKRCTIPWG